MIKNINRNQRVSHEIKKKISIILQHSIKDPRINMINVSDLKLSKDFKYGKVFITFLNIFCEKNNKIINEKLKIINKASGFIRHLLYKSMNLYAIPNLIFLYDNYWTNYIHISKLISNKIKNNK